MIRIIFLSAAVLMLAACNATESRGAGQDGQTGSPAAKAPPRPGNGRDLPARSVFDAMPDFNGIGPLRFGMGADEMRKAWGAPLYGEAQPNDPKACHYLRPGKDDYDLLLMVEGDRFVRVDVKTDEKAAPGGGRVGMTAQQIEKLYAGHVTAMPGKYDAAARVLSIASPQDEQARLIFETDASGVVKSWRIGVAPQVDYVEGCG
ncbi:MAG: lectin [Proteobacteria bacterium]|nr:lectin [Pseudomonadota bacterium]